MMEGWIQRGNLRNINQWAFRKLKQLQYCYFQAIQVNWCDKMSTELEDKRHIFESLTFPLVVVAMVYSSPLLGLVSPSEQEVWIIWSLLLPNSENVFVLLSISFFFQRKILPFLFSYIFSPLPKQLQKLRKNWKENNQPYPLYSILVCLILSYETLYM